MDQDTADRMVVREPTVCTHVSRILAELHVASRTHAALYQTAMVINGGYCHEHPQSFSR